MRWLDLTVIALYLIAITWFGSRFKKSQKTLKDYFLGGRSAPWWAIAFSIVSAETSTLTVIGTPALSFRGNFGFLQVVLGYLLARMVISALFFGAAHIFNPGATLWSSAAIAIEAGLMLGMLYHVTRSLWPCIGMHAAWNFMQGTVFGIPVSGTHADGWLVSSRTGPNWLSGGVFGAEASVIALLICSTFTTALLVIAWRRRSFIAPSWHRH